MERKLDRRQMLAATAALGAMPLLPSLATIATDSSPNMPDYPDLFGDKIAVTFDAAHELRVNKMLVMEQIYELGAMAPVLILFEYRDPLDRDPERFLTLENATEAYEKITSCYRHCRIDKGSRIPCGKIFDRARFLDREAVEARDRRVEPLLYEVIFEDYLCQLGAARQLVNITQLCVRGSDDTSDGKTYHSMGIADRSPMSRFAFVDLGYSPRPADRQHEYTLIDEAVKS